MLKTFILVGLAFMLGAALASGYVWHMVQTELKSVDPADDSTQVEPEQVQQTETSHGSVAETIPEEGIPVSTDSLTETQKSLLNTVGVDTDSFVLTPEMVQCAEDALGNERVLEIMEGATPSVLEAMKLTPCL